MAVVLLHRCAGANLSAKARFVRAAAIKTCESLRALLLRRFKALQRFSDSLPVMKHAKGKIGR